MMMMENLDMVNRDPNNINDHLKVCHVLTIFFGGIKLVCVCVCGGVKDLYLRLENDLILQY